MNLLKKLFGKKIYTFRVRSQKVEMYQVQARSKREAWKKIDDLFDSLNSSVVDVELVKENDL
jgi:hypothetical protein